MGAQLALPVAALTFVAAFFPFVGAIRELDETETVDPEESDEGTAADRVQAGG